MQSDFHSKFNLLWSATILIEMKSVVIGTAGHIDHGKTALIKALTGIDADRLQEEKRRGITIDLGFAHLDLPQPEGESLRLGFVDVPGHERFVRNMLAGAGGIDLVLLVIAADDSIKPQTREHLDICRMLDVRRGITVLTKSDLVSTEVLDAVRMEVSEFLRGSFLEKSPIVSVSSLTGAGIAELKLALSKTALETFSKDASSLPRLPIDRVFTIKGFGTVVTGTLVAGTIREGDDLEVFPSGARVRVRNVQVHGEPAKQAVAGQRTALNLVGVSKSDLARGMVLAMPQNFAAANRADVLLSILGSVKPVKNRARVHLHTHTFETVATVVLQDKKELSDGGQAFATLKLAEPTLLLPGDRFVIRQFSPLVTIGGGVVLDASNPPRGITKIEASEFLKVLNSASPEVVLEARIARRETSGLTIAQAVSETGWTSKRVAAIAQGLFDKKSIVQTGELLVSAKIFQQFSTNALAAITRFHQQNPLTPGISREALREHLKLGSNFIATLIEQLVHEKQLEISGDQIHLAGRNVTMKDEEAESKAIIEKAFVSAGLQVPALKDVLASLKVDRTRAQKIVTLLLRDKVLVKISDDLVFHRDCLTELRKRVSGEKAKSTKMDVGRFKDLVGISRKYAIPLLEYLDRERVTKRVGNDRIIL